MKRIARWLASTSNRTFVVWPIVVLAFELAWRRGALAVQPAGLVLLAWGYLQYRLVGAYRSRLGGGGPGMGVPPERLVTSGPYAVLRNPMYAGHLVFFAGLALALRSWLAVALLVAHAAWFDRRVRDDEARLRALFPADYPRYAAHVRRWRPRLP